MKAVLFIAAVLLVIAIVYWKSNSPKYSDKPDEITIQPKPKAPLQFDSTPDQPQAFGYKTQWFAVKSTDTDSVVQALGFKDVHAANWSTGMAGAFGSDGDYYFVTPPVQGWTFIVNTGMPALGEKHEEDVRQAAPIKTIISLSQTFGEAYYYGSHRIVSYYAWAKAMNGELVRAYGYLGESGEILADVGALTEEESQLHMQFGDPVTDEDAKWPNEEDVIAIAAAWTVNPLTQQAGLGTGYVGRLVSN
ncbi:hypothetical protein H8B09_00480 [Paenibacillus sp. PR3]|uniref:Uncharacterized protein n=1 Tax=Paenibacillus terricola TaxID=2763503 RepID=A0ABR8MQP5_9BACL|nr:hypothetical protein [Paenibacillus terricola]MBD3917212.1 hypothetical protein [Paenibacillus terricola]